MTDEVTITSLFILWSDHHGMHKHSFTHERCLKYLRHRLMSRGQRSIPSITAVLNARQNIIIAGR
jgi:hypothetical protein